MVIRNRYLYLVSCISSFLCIGCATKLQTFDPAGDPSPGIPIGTPVPVLIETLTKYKTIKGGNSDLCSDETNITLSFLPLGKRTYINFDPSNLSKGEFSLELADNGSLKSVKNTSDSSSGIDSVNTLASTLLPFIATEKQRGEISESSSTGLVTGKPAKTLKEENCLLSVQQVVNVSTANIL